MLTEVALKKKQLTWHAASASRHMAGSAHLACCADTFRSSETDKIQPCLNMSLLLFMSMSCSSMASLITSTSLSLNSTICTHIQGTRFREVLLLRSGHAPIEQAVPSRHAPVRQARGLQTTLPWQVLISLSTKAARPCCTWSACENFTHNVDRSNLACSSCTTPHALLQGATKADISSAP